MAACKYGYKECDGCLECQEESEPEPSQYCERTGQPIYSGDKYYIIDGEVVCEDYIEQCANYAV